MRTPCIMVVDDNEADQFIAKMTIQEYDPNIKIIKAYDGEEALEILGNIDQQPDIIFLDTNMPRMNGHEFLAAYSKKKGSNLVVIRMLTSSAQEKDKEEALAYSNVKDYLLKPLEVQNIEEVIKPLAADGK